MGNVTINSMVRCTACLNAAVSGSRGQVPNLLNGETVIVTTTTTATTTGGSYANTVSFSGGGGGSLYGGGGGYSAAGGSGGSGSRKPYSISPSGGYSGAVQSLRNLASAMGSYHSRLPDLPEVKRTEPYRAYKGSFLTVEGTPYGVSLGFRGVSGGGKFGTEGYAACSYHQQHEIPVRGCHCGFWSVKKTEDIFSSADAWMLEVDLHGRVIRGTDGYRAQWQRVISVTPPAWCHECDDLSPATCLVRKEDTELLAVCCVYCAVDNETVPIPRPLSWLRSKLGVEVKTEFLTDDVPPLPPRAAEESDDARKALQRSIDLYVANMNETLMRRLLKVHGDIVKTPGLVAGRTWRKMIRTSATERPLVLEMCVANGGLAMQLARTGPDESTAAEVIWQEQLPL